MLDEKMTIESIISAFERNPYTDKRPKMKYVPYQGGFNIPEYEFDDFATEIEPLEQVSWFKNREGFGGFFIKYGNEKLTLIAAYDYDPEYFGFRKTMVVGFIYNGIAAFIGLPFSDGIRASHKPNCFNRKFRSVEDLLNKAKTDEEYMKILHEIGWTNATRLGCAIYCDCGLTENEK